MSEHSAWVWFPLPPKGARGHTNGRAHQFRAAALTKRYKADCALLWRNALHKRDVRATPGATVEIRWCDGRRPPYDDGLYRPRDEDNARAALKPCADAMAEAGVVPVDTRKHVSWATVTFVPPKEQPLPGVYLRVWYRGMSK